MSGVHEIKKGLSYGEAMKKGRSRALFFLIQENRSSVSYGTRKISGCL